MNCKEALHNLLCSELGDCACMYNDLKNKQLKHRIKTSLDYYIWNATFYKKLYYFLSIIAIILPSAATLVSGLKLGTDHDWLIPTITAVTAIVSGLLALLKCNDKKKSYRDSAENIKSELSSYHNKAGKYKNIVFNDANNEKILAENIEKIISTGYSKISALEHTSGQV